MKKQIQAWAVPLAVSMMLVLNSVVFANFDVDDADQPSADRRANELAPRIIVKFRSSSRLSKSSHNERGRSALERLESREAVRLERQRGIATGAEILRMDPSDRGRLQRVIAVLRADPDVEYAEEDLLLQPLLIPDDPRYNEQWQYFENTGGLRMTGAWDST
ncbi:MAG: hypothetical protein P8L39_16700, partial [Halioglobus sp.]|nr:hypothetical protein [Halioglobus sp.]